MQVKEQVEKKPQKKKPSKPSKKPNRLKALLTVDNFYILRDTVITVAIAAIAIKFIVA